MRYCQLLNSIIASSYRSMVNNCHPESVLTRLAYTFKEIYFIMPPFSFGEMKNLRSEIGEIIRKSVKAIKVIDLLDKCK